MNMTFDQAIASLSIREEWDVIIDFITEQREIAIADFQSPDLTDNPSKLARLAGEIAAYDTIIRNFRDATSTS
jgi:hypothetical protein